MDLPAGCLAMVVGPVGCGKSALLAALLSELHTTGTQPFLAGSVAYTAQVSRIGRLLSPGRLLWSLRATGQCKSSDLLSHVQAGAADASKTQAVAGFPLVDVAAGRSHTLPRDQEMTAGMAQEAFVFNASLRDNILLGQPYDEATYNRVLDACALRPDLATLEAGDETELGEAGVTSSGGQRQRVALARACYTGVLRCRCMTAAAAQAAYCAVRGCLQAAARAAAGYRQLLTMYHAWPAGADVNLLDDPLSAVDAHVGSQLMDQVRLITQLLMPCRM